MFALCAVYACGSPSRDYGAGDGGGGKAGASSAGGGGVSNAGKTSSGGKASTGGKSGVEAGAGGIPEGGTGPTAGQGGEGGEVIVPPEPGRPGSAIVAGGYYMKSKHYSLVSTLGESPGGNGVYSSKKYVLLGGVVGTTQP